ncbi:AraC family transcriptional regulator [Paenibacillus sp. HWE-109]|uniref:helix-turn-helix transcriptional regulator n=1 Tax=Paenibacillus sp. HWE-109 TaxID=1306526 RepID=UPI001EDEF699|nr:AraC family transcriptional regulator [Paenibacillus sp. HWE-109]UKS27019.1 AraC family transcriptional regulator [Paenibacillus sp. HWE-109]
MEDQIYQSTDLFVNNKLQELPIHMKYKETEKNFYMNFHSHAGYEIYLFHEGSGYFLIEENIYPLEGNDMILISTLEAHKSSPKLQMPSTRSAIHFLPELLDPEIRGRFLAVFDRSNPHRHIRLSGDRLRHFEYLLERLHEEYTMLNTDDFLTMRIYLNEMLLEIHRLVFNGSEQELEPIARNTINPKIEEAVKYLSQNFQSDIPLEKLAQDLYINPYYLCHLFKKTIGLTITDFLNHTRIHHAKRLLANTNMPITEISQSVGFNSFSYFGRAFKKLVGTTPRTYRNKQ